MSTSACLSEVSTASRKSGVISRPRCGWNGSSCGGTDAMEGEDGAEPGEERPRQPVRAGEVKGLETGSDGPPSHDQARHAPHADRRAGRRVHLWKAGAPPTIDRMTPEKSKPASALGTAATRAAGRLLARKPRARRPRSARLRSQPAAGQVPVRSASGASAMTSSAGTPWAASSASCAMGQRHFAVDERRRGRCPHRSTASGGTRPMRPTASSNEMQVPPVRARSPPASTTSLTERSGAIAAATVGRQTRLGDDGNRLAGVRASRTRTLGRRRGIDGTQRRRRP